MICKHKSTEDYIQLFQSMATQKPSLKDTLRAFVQDGETAIMNAHQSEFASSISFIDSVHVRRNIEHMIKNEYRLGESFFNKV